MLPEEMLAIRRRFEALRKQTELLLTELEADHCGKAGIHANAAYKTCGDLSTQFEKTLTHIRQASETANPKLRGPSLQRDSRIRTQTRYSHGRRVIRREIVG